MSRDETAMFHVPALVNRLPVDMRAEPGTVRELLAGVGKDGRFSLYAWRSGEGNSICYVSTRAGGGCFDKFLGPFNVSVTDFDHLGSGDPVIISGPVRDDVVGVEVLANGKNHAAIVRNNAAFVQLPDPTILPSAIERVRVTLEDGTSHDVRH